MNMIAEKKQFVSYVFIACFFMILVAGCSKSPIKKIEEEQKENKAKLEKTWDDVEKVFECLGSIVNEQQYTAPGDTEDVVVDAPLYVIIKPNSESEIKLESFFKSKTPQLIDIDIDSSDCKDLLEYAFQNKSTVKNGVVLECRTRSEGRGVLKITAKNEFGRVLAQHALNVIVSTCDASAINDAHLQPIIFEPDIQGSSTQSISSVLPDFLSNASFDCSLSPSNDAFSVKLEENNLTVSYNGNKGYGDHFLTLKSSSQNSDEIQKIFHIDNFSILLSVTVKQPPKEFTFEEAFNKLLSARDVELTKSLQDLNGKISTVKNHLDDLTKAKDGIDRIKKALAKNEDTVTNEKTRESKVIKYNSVAVKQKILELIEKRKNAKQEYHCFEISNQKIDSFEGAKSDFNEKGLEDLQGKINAYIDALREKSKDTTKKPEKLAEDDVRSFIQANSNIIDSLCVFLQKFSVYNNAFDDLYNNLRNTFKLQEVAESNKWDDELKDIQAKVAEYLCFESQRMEDISKKVPESAVPIIVTGATIPEKVDEKEGYWDKVGHDLKTGWDCLIEHGDIFTFTWKLLTCLFQFGGDDDDSTSNPESGRGPDTTQDQSPNPDQKKEHEFRDGIKVVPSPYAQEGSGWFAGVVEGGESFIVENGNQSISKMFNIAEVPDKDLFPINEFIRGIKAGKLDYANSLSPLSPYPNSFYFAKKSKDEDFLRDYGIFDTTICVTWTDATHYSIDPMDSNAVKIEHAIPNGVNTIKRKDENKSQVLLDYSAIGGQDELYVNIEGKTYKLLCEKGVSDWIKLKFQTNFQTDDTETNYNFSVGENVVTCGSYRWKKAEGSNDYIYSPN